MGRTRYGRIVEKDRDNARGLSLFIPSTSAIYIAGTWTAGRNAAGEYRHRRTAAGANHNPAYALILDGGLLQTTETAVPTFGEVARGPRLNSIDLIYEIGTEVIDAHAATLTTMEFANEAAGTATNRPITGTLAITTNANPRVTRLTVTTPFVIDGDMVVSLEVRVDDTTGGGGVYDLMGAFFNYDLLL